MNNPMYVRGWIDPKYPRNLYQWLCKRIGLRREPTWIMYDFYISMPFFAEWMALSIGMWLGDMLTWQVTLLVQAAYFIGAIRGHVLWAGRR